MESIPAPRQRHALFVVAVVAATFGSACGSKSPVSPTTSTYATGILALYTETVTISGVR